MGRLKNLAPQLGGLAPRLVRMTDEQGHSPVAEPWRRNYSLRRWKVLRIAIFQRDGFKCQMCGKLQADTSQLTCDHIDPSLKTEGDRFWDEANLQTLCTDPCHNTHKQALERRYR